MARIPRISTRIRADVLRTRRPEFSGVAASAAEPFDVLSEGFSDISDDFFSIAKALSRNKPEGDDTATDDTDNDGSASARPFAGGGSGGGRERAVNAPDVAFTRSGGGIGHAASAVPDRNQSAFERLAGPALGAKAPTEESLLNGVRMITNTVKQTQAQHTLNAYGPVLDQALTGFRGLAGLEAINAWAKTRDDMRKTAVNFLSTITDEDVRRMAEPPIKRAVEEKVAEADLHVLSAQQGFTDEVFDRTQASLRKSVMEDPGRAPERAEEAAASTFEHVLARTGDKAAAEHAAQLAGTGINAQAISVLTDRGQMAEARAYFEAVKGRVDPDNTARLERLLEEGELRQEVDRATDEILALGRPEEEALQKASGLPDGPHRDMVMRRIGGHHRQRRALEQQEFRERFNVLEKKVQNGGELIPSEVIDLPDGVRHYLETKREQAQLKAINPEYQPAGDGGSTWAMFHDFAQDDDALPELSLEELKQQFRTGVTEAQWGDTILPKWKMARVATGRDIPSDGDPILSDLQRVDQHAAQAGIDARNMPGPYGQFVTEYNQRIAAENAVTAQAKRLILEDMVVDRVALNGAGGSGFLTGGDGGDVLFGGTNADALTVDTQVAAGNIENDRQLWLDTDEASIESVTDGQQAMLGPVIKLGGQLIRRWLGRVRPKPKKGKDRYKRDNAGNEFVQLEDGKIDLGEIDPVTAAEIGVEAASIRLRKGNHDPAKGEKYGDVHIEAAHGAQIRRILGSDQKPIFDDVAEYVEFIAENWTEIRDNGRGRLVLVVRDQSLTGSDKKQDVLIVELEKSISTDYYDAKTASPWTNRSLKKMRLLHQR